MNKDNNKIIRNPLSRAMTSYCIMFAILFAIFISTMNFWIYSQDMINRYQVYTADILNYVVRSIDGDDLQECIRTGQKSKKYLELQKLTNDLKETHNLEFLYIIKPISETPPNNMMDVLAAYTQAGKDAGTDGLTDLGNLTGYLYPPEVAKSYLVRMDKNPAVTFFKNDTEFGNIYTAIRPIFNSQGEPIAVICADVLIDEIEAGKTRFIHMSILTALISGFILVSFMSFWLHRRIAEPISRLKNSAVSFILKTHAEVDLDAFDFEDPQINTNDELQDLAIALSSMCAEMKTYTEELILADREMNDLREKVVEMDTIAYQDHLTGAGNKAAYEKYLTRLDKDIFSGKAEFAVAMIDINYLKKINDNFGHDKGNLYIIKMYSLIKTFLTAAPIFRIGGDAGQRLKSIRERMEVQKQNPELEPWEKVSAAIGLAYYNILEHDRAREVVKEADQKMYANKKAMHACRD